MRVRTATLIVAFLLIAGMASAQNLVPLPTFPSNYLTQWTDQNGAWTHATGAGNDTNGGDGSGACTVIESGGGESCSITTACITVAASTTYGYGIKMKHGGNVSNITLRAYEFSSGDCSGMGGIIINTVSTAFPNSAWTTHNSTATTSGTAGSVQFDVDMSATFMSGDTINVNVDWGFFGIGMVPVEIQSFTTGDP